MSDTNSKQNTIDLESSKEQQYGQRVKDDSDNVSVLAIGEKKLTWVQATLLLLTEYVVLAILAMPYSFQVLGYAGGTLATLIIGISTYYTSIVLWRYCLANPHVRDICDAAIMGLHVNAGATAIQTIRGGKECTLVWGVVMGILMWLPSNLRDFKHMAYFGILASTTMFVCAILVISGHGVQGRPNGIAIDIPIAHTVWAPEGTTFVQGMNALLNIVYTFIGHALIPSFVGDMERPEDFPKALGVSLAFQLTLYTLAGAIVYRYAGPATTAPAYGSLIAKYGRVAAGFTLPTIIIVGVLYSLVTSRAILFQIFPAGSPHRTQHTTKGWLTWVVIVFGGWVISFVIGEAVPFFNDLLSLIASLFDSWFGYLMWAGAFFSLSKSNGLSFRNGPILHKLEYILNVLIAITGAFFFVAGTYASIQSILDSYAKGAIKAPFQCTNTGFVFDR